MTIEERLTRRAPDDVIYLGELAERVLQSDTGLLLHALTNGRIMLEARVHSNGHLSADRILGRIEAYARLWTDLEQFVVDMQQAKAAVQATQYVSSSTLPMQAHPEGDMS